jgi:hypothetical protein
VAGRGGKRPEGRDAGGTAGGRYPHGD